MLPLTCSIVLMITVKSSVPSISVSLMMGILPHVFCIPGGIVNGSTDCMKSKPTAERTKPVMSLEGVLVSGEKAILEDYSMK